MDRGEKVPGELFVSGGNATKVLEATETALDDIAPFVDPLVEGVDSDAIGFVRNDRLCAALGDLRPQVVAVIPLVGKQGTHLRGERQNIGSGGDVGILAGRQMKDDRPTKRIAQGMDFSRAPTAGTADCLIAFPPFPPEAQR